MHAHVPVERLVNLLDPAANLILNMSLDDAIARVGSGDPAAVREIDGQFALLHKQGTAIRMARSIGRPMRYFLAKRAEGPCLVVAERMNEIRDFLNEEGLAGQFHPSYTRMVPAHHIVELQLIGCPDPNPVNTRFLNPQRNRLPADLDVIGERYIGTLGDECNRWLDRIGPQEPIGVLFSGGIDSGSVFLVIYHLLLQRGESPSRLKAFTLSVAGRGEDVKQAAEFLRELGLGLFLEPIEVPPEAVDFREAIRTIEDYKPLDVQSACMAGALCRGIRERYPDWRYLVDGDGGDENLKDYPIEDNPELTIRSVLSNLMLYQEGWGVDAVKHSLTYSGGQSRGHVRTWAPARRWGFTGFSPYALPNVIEVAEGIPFIELTDWSHEKLYALKGDIVRRGVKAVTGFEMPVFEKRRFQRGAAGEAEFSRLFPDEDGEYRRAFVEMYP
jgi:asparagine synthase (glutamine-hydrolysing)